MSNTHRSKGILIIMVFSLGTGLGFWIAPEKMVTEKIVEVEKVKKLQATNQDVYSYCVQQARSTLYYTWDGKPKEGTTPSNADDFIDNCFSKLTTPDHEK